MAKLLVSGGLILGSVALIESVAFWPAVFMVGLAGFSIGMLFGSSGDNSKAPDAKSRPRPGKWEKKLRQAIKNDLVVRGGISIELLERSKSMKIEKSKYPYLPDIALKVLNNNISDYVCLYIDVEVDEPWTLDKNGNKMPIHTIDDNKQKSRDSFFREKNWIVIRFSEQQVYYETDKCVNLIHDLIICIFQLNDSLLKSTYPSPQKRWSWQEAVKIERP
ncbi:hypothetical protein [Thermosynechococcus sp.]|uniref:hypothetical protein n=1 Tax=Thermosynechococcus sp. TaxID=2814275 RepID=UPI00391DBF4E